MESYLLSSFTIKVRDIRKPSERIRLDSFDGHNDLLTQFAEYLNSYGLHIIEFERVKKTAKIEKIETLLKERIVRGVMKAGHYGYKNDILDVYKNTKKGSVDVGDAVMLPFFFYFYLPKNEHTGIFILQRLGQFGIQELLLDRFEYWFKAKFTNYKIECLTYTPSNVLGKIIDDARVTKLRLLKFQLPTDLAEKHQSKDGNQPYYEITLHAGRHGAWKIKDRIKGFLSNKITPGEVLQSEIFKFEDNDEMKIEIEINGRPRTLSVRDPSKFKANFDVTNQLDFDITTGHATFESLTKSAEELLSDLKTKLYKENS